MTNNLVPSLSFMERSQHVRHLTDALATLLNAPDLNLDELEPETIAAIEQARETLDMVRRGLKRFRVRYARLVVMEADVLAESPNDFAHMPLRFRRPTRLFCENRSKV